MDSTETIKEQAKRIVNNLISEEIKLLFKCKKCSSWFDFERLDKRINENVCDLCSVRLHELETKAKQIEEFLKRKKDVEQDLKIIVSQYKPRKNSHTNRSNEQIWKDYEYKFLND